MMKVHRGEQKTPPKHSFILNDFISLLISTVLVKLIKNLNQYKLCVEQFQRSNTLLLRYITMRGTLHTYLCWCDRSIEV